MNNLAFYLLSNLLTKIIKILKISFNFNVLSVKYDEYYIILDLFSFIRNMFISSEFSYIINHYYKKHGKNFKNWVGKFYGLLMLGVTLFLFLFGPYVFYFFSLPLNKFSSFSFFMRGLSFLAILMFLLGFYKGLLYGENRIKSISLAVPISSLAMLLFLYSHYIFPITIVLIGGQLIYSGIQFLFSFFSLKGIRSKEPLLSKDKKAFHKEIGILAINALFLIITRIIGNKILSKYRGKLSMSKYAGDIIWTLIGFIVNPIIDFTVVNLNSQNNKSLTIKNALLKSHKINIYITSFMFFIGAPFTGYILQKIFYIAEIKPFINFMSYSSLIIYPFIQSKLLKVISSTQKKSKYNLYTNMIQCIIYIITAFILGIFNLVPYYLIPIIAQVVGSYMQLFILYYQYKTLINRKNFLFHTLMAFGVFMFFYYGFLFK